MAASSAEGERLFDGIVEAVQQATLVAQTGGRVVAVERDVDDEVARGTLILRLAGVEVKYILPIFFLILHSNLGHC